MKVKRTHKIAASRIERGEMKVNQSKYLNLECCGPIENKYKLNLKGNVWCSIVWIRIDLVGRGMNVQICLVILGLDI